MIFLIVDANGFVLITLIGAQTQNLDSSAVGRDGCSDRYRPLTDMSVLYLDAFSYSFRNSGDGYII